MLPPDDPVEGNPSSDSSDKIGTRLVPAPRGDEISGFVGIFSGTGRLLHPIPMTETDQRAML